MDKKISFRRTRFFGAGDGNRTCNLLIIYNYVTDEYKCAHCDYKESRDHNAPASLSDEDIAKAEAEIVDAVNALRAEKGLSQLWTNDVWDAWADKRSESISMNYTHNGWTHAEGTTYTLAENIAAGKASGEEFFKAFCKSSQHKSAMLQKKAVGIAVSIYITEDGRTYCTMSIIAEK